MSGMFRRFPAAVVAKALKSATAWAAIGSAPVGFEPVGFEPAYLLCRAAGPGGSHVRRGGRRGVPCPRSGPRPTAMSRLWLLLRRQRFRIEISRADVTLCSNKPLGSLRVSCVNRNFQNRCNYAERYLHISVRIFARAKSAVGI